MKLTVILLFLLNTNILCAQTFEADLSIAVTSDAFSDGISPGESGLFNLSVTNLGPDSYPEGSEFNFSYAYKLNQDTFIIEEYFYTGLVSSNCEFITSGTATPAPPDENNYFSPITYLQLTGALDVGQTATCQISLSFEESGYLETRWRLFTNNDPQTDNNEVFFTLRGAPQAVPLNIKFFLIAGFLSLFLMHFRKNKGK